MMKDNSVRCEKHERHIQSMMTDFLEEMKRGWQEANTILQGFLDLECSHVQPT
jgi:hypothetical protein